VGYSLIFDKAFSIPMLLAFPGRRLRAEAAGSLPWERAWLASVDWTSRISLWQRMLVAVLALCLPAWAFEAGIISAAFYTTLVIVAVLTSQAAGAWLEFVLRKGWPLLSGDTPAGATIPAVEKEPGQLVA